MHGFLLCWQMAKSCLAAAPAFNYLDTKVLLTMHHLSQNESRQRMLRPFLALCTLLSSCCVDGRGHLVDPNATLSFFFTADPQFGWGASYSGNEER